MSAANDIRHVPDPLAYGVAEAAIALSVSESQIWIWLRQGRIRTFKAGARTLIRREELLRFLDALAADSQPSAA